MSDWPPSSGPGGESPPPSWGSGPGGPPGPPPGPPPGGFGGPPPGGGPGYGGPPPGYGGPPQAGSNGFAIAGLVLGIIAVVTFFIPFLGIVLGLVGLVLSILGRKRAKETGVGGGMAIAGLVLSILGLIAGILWLVFFVLIVNEAGNVLEGLGDDFNLCLQGDQAACDRLDDAGSDAGGAESDLAAAGESTQGSDGSFDDLFQGSSPPGAPTTSATTGPDATSGPVAATERSVFELAVGDCFDDPDATDQIQTVPLVPCDQPHDNEIIALVTHPADAGEPFPGIEAIEAFGDDGCKGETFISYVGIEYELSRYFITTLTPTEGSWEQGDREVVCYVNVPGEEITGSVRGTAQ